MRRLVFILSLLLLVQSALAQSSNFKSEMYMAAWRSLNPGAPHPDFPAGWDATWWTVGTINTIDSTAQDVKRLAKLCSEGGNARDFVKPATLAYLHQYDRDFGFPDWKVPKGTLLMLDYEGTELTGKFPELLCNNTRPTTKKYVQYGPFGLSADVYEGVGWPNAQMREIDFFCIARTLKRCESRYLPMCGDYLLVNLDIDKDPAQQEVQYRMRAVWIAALRAKYPKKKILGMVVSYHSFGFDSLLTDEERHRVARQLITLCDGCLYWGLYDPALPADIAALAGEPLKRFEGEEAWEVN